jgi:methylthioribose-1-phosphate isomerase
MTVRPPTVQWLAADGVTHRQPGPAAADNGFLDIIDQTRLPRELVRLHLCAPQDIHDAIQRLAVRGAPAIGCAAALGLAAAAQRLPNGAPADFLAQCRRIAAFLAASRPTAVNLEWALNRCLDKLSPGPVPEMRQALLDEALAILQEDIAMCDAIGRHGMALLKPDAGILTHCNAGALATGGSGTALAPIYAAHAAGCRVHVFSDETRPLLQGARLTAWELSVSGIQVTTICDSMAAQVMREKRVDLVIVGADRVAANGDAANKIGTYQLAIAARYHRIPFYIAMPYSTIDRKLPNGDGIPIEQRSADEIAHCPGAQVYNPAFDVTPHELITGYITERGILTTP